MSISVEAEEGRSQALQGVGGGRVKDRIDILGMIVVLQMHITLLAEH